MLDVMLENKVEMQVAEIAHSEQLLSHKSR